MGLPRVMLDGASGNLVVRATLTVLHPTLNTPNKQIYCKTNGFLMILMSSGSHLGTTCGHMGHMRSHLEVQERLREGHVPQMLFFHLFYKHFQASLKAASVSFVIEVVGGRPPGAVFHWFYKHFWWSPRSRGGPCRAHVLKTISFMMFF